MWKSTAVLAFLMMCRWQHALQKICWYLMMGMLTLIVTWVDARCLWWMVAAAGLVVGSGCVVPVDDHSIGRIAGERTAAAAVAYAAADNARLRMVVSVCKLPCETCESGACHSFQRCGSPYPE